MNITTKYSVGETVCFLDGMRIITTNIAGVDVYVRGAAPISIVYRFAVYPQKREDEVFLSKEELINNIK
jgi:hypothetical protein